MNQTVEEQQSAKKSNNPDLFYKQDQGKDNNIPESEVEEIATE